MSHSAFDFFTRSAIRPQVLPPKRLQKFNMKVFICVIKKTSSFPPGAAFSKYLDSFPWNYLYASMLYPHWCFLQHTYISLIKVHHRSIILFIAFGEIHNCKSLWQHYLRLDFSSKSYIAMLQYSLPLVVLFR